jgi:uncharacterized membrane protein YeaQ/YmgE (transglycosylase-associated protein family)
MTLIARILGLSFLCSVLAGWLGLALFREYADHIVPAILFGLAGAIVGAVAGAAREVVNGRNASSV